MKELLLKAYEDRHTDFLHVRSQFPDDDMAGPFPMSPTSKFAKQRNPLLVIGQETFGWDYINKGLEHLMKVYENFNLGENYYASPFWNVLSKVESSLGNNPYSSAWTNISQYDLNEGRAYGEHKARFS